jgi:exodeoxyribonuclease VII large subunit
LDPNRPLALGFALVRRPDGAIVRSGAALEPGEAVELQFADIARGAVIDGEPGPARPPAKARAARARPDRQQGDLF